ncbi:MAG: hypothetical protein FWH48_09025 [Oscillospiraceae bacterium]|nr:hypothetical protein [Oscillospiraceae bacterium]
MTCEEKRQQELVMGIADYLTDWVEDDETSTLDIDESIKMIEMYGVKFDTPCDDLVINAIRHLDDIMNPWSKATIPDILENIGFTEEETNRYNHVTESILYIQLGPPTAVVDE